MTAAVRSKTAKQRTKLTPGLRKKAERMLEDGADPDEVANVLAEKGFSRADATRLSEDMHEEVQARLRGDRDVLSPSARGARKTRKEHWYAMIVVGTLKLAFDAYRISAGGATMALPLGAIALIVGLGGLVLVSRKDNSG